MPDYDPTSIPILDDVIEKEAESNDEESESLDADSLDAVNNLDLFPSDSAIESSTIDAATTAETEPSIVDLHTETTDNNITTDENKDSEALDYTPIEPPADDSIPLGSALIDYDNHQPTDQMRTETPETIDAQAIGLTNSQSLQQPEEQPDTTDTSIPDSSAATSFETISIQTITDDIVNKLMPGIENQLRFLIQQELEDKLPDEIKKITDTVKPDNAANDTTTDDK